MRVLFFSFLLLIGFGNAVNAQTIDKMVYDWTTGGDGTVAGIDDILEYITTVTNGSSTMTNALVTEIIPAGTSYLPGSTFMNGIAVADANGKMPFAGLGGLINSSGTPGGIDAGATVTIVFRVTVTANAGSITNNAATLQGNSGAGSVHLTSPVTTTLLTRDAACNVVFQVTPNTQAGSTSSPYLKISQVNLNNGTNGSLIYNGATGACKEITGNGTFNLPAGTLLKDVSAMAFDRSSLRLYFVNNSTTTDKDLCYVDALNGIPANVAAYRFTGYPLETNTAAGYNITRMTVGTDGKIYSLTDNGQDLISFTVTGNIPAITRSGALVNDAINAFDVLAERGGDIISNGSGKLFLVPNSGNVYRIEPSTRVATYLGTITGMPARGCNSLAMDQSGNIYMGGAYSNVYKVNLTTFSLTQINTTSTNVWMSGDFASCTLSIQPLRVATNDISTRNDLDALQPGSEIVAKVQPNPFNKVLNAQVQLNKAEVVQVRLIDFYGKTVFTRSEKLGAGVNSLSLPVPSGLSAGMYVLELWAGNNRLVQKKLLKQ
ncbi:T9SS type A sorting domain-containing protein [Niastella caeni]|nr:T9SS type A sorting domain-containing protein [Niastella caeni]